MKHASTILGSAVAAMLLLPLLAAAIISSAGPSAADATVPCTETPTAATSVLAPVPGTASSAPDGLSPAGEGGIGFALPAPGEPRLDSLPTAPMSIPTDIQDLYVKAAAAYHLPWTLLAGIGMEESAHGRTTATSSAGAQGLMQFMPATFAAYGVDGDGDGRAIITDPADSIMTAGNYLTASGALAGGPEGVRRALYAYNHADWYVNDVLYYAQAYGGGTVAGIAAGCGLAGGDAAGNPSLLPVDDAGIATVLTWATSQRGKPYLLGGEGPDAWDCSAFTRAAYASIGITLPRTAQAQRDWLAAGHGYRVSAGQERPGDLIFTDSYLGPNVIGHVMLVDDPGQHLSIEAGGNHVDSYRYTQWADHPLYQFWRVGLTPAS